MTEPVLKSRLHSLLLVQQLPVFQLNWAKWVTAVSAGVWRGMKSNWEPEKMLMLMTGTLPFQSLGEESDICPENHIKRQILPSATAQ